MKRPFDINEVRECPLSGPVKGKSVGWSLAKPVPGPLFVVEIPQRIAWAWAVLRGKACAVAWR